MAKANPKAWFTSPIAKITFRPVDKWAKFHEKHRPFFETWGEAHDWMLAKADERLKRATAENNSATMHRMKIKAMSDPTKGNGDTDKGAQS